MLKSDYHPKAFLTLKRNVHNGLVNRTKIVSLLEESPLTAQTLAQKTGLRYGSILHHLHLLEAEHIIARSDRKPHIWRLTGAGQQTLLKK